MKILYVYMSGVCHWDTYNNISQYANILSKTLFTSDLKELHRKQNLTLGSAFLHPASFVLLRHQLREQVERNWGRGVSWGARDLTISLTPSHNISMREEDTQISKISYSLFSSIPMQERHSCFEIFRSESWSQYLDTEGFWCHLYLKVEKHLARVF